MEAAKDGPMTRLKTVGGLTGALLLAACASDRSPPPNAAYDLPPPPVAEPAVPAGPAVPLNGV